MLRFPTRYAVLAAALHLTIQPAHAGACGGMQLHAHRGAAGQPENSVGAVVAALAMPYQAVELDLRRLRDGAWVIHHDPFLGRVVAYSQKGSPPVHTPESMTSAQWSQATVRDRTGRPTKQPAPSLEAVLDVAAQRASPQKQLNLEIKSKTGCADLAQLNGDIAATMPTGSWMYSAFSEPALKCLRKADPNVYLGLLIGPERESLSFKGVSLADAARRFGGASNKMVANGLAELDAATNRHYLATQEVPGLARSLGSNAGLHIDVRSYLTHPDFVRVARASGLKVMTYSTEGDAEHQASLRKIKASGVALPDAAIIDSAPGDFCKRLG